MLNHLSMAKKAAGATALAAILGVITTAVISVQVFRSTIVARQTESLTSTVEARKTSIEHYFAQISEQVKTFALRVDVAEATEKFARAFQAVPAELDAAGVDRSGFAADVQRYYDREFRPRIVDAGGNYGGAARYVPAGETGVALQALYIANNPNDVGEKLNLDADGANIEYNRLHRRYHPSIRAYLESFGYYDIFLFDLEGNLIYSVFKETDFATNFKSGPYRDTNFADAYRSALSLPKGEVVLKDFRSYEPSYGAPASFIASPVFNDGDRVGVAVFQMPIDRINAVLTDPAGLGETGDTFMVGKDGYMRSQSRFIEDNTILTMRPDTESAGLAVQKSGIIEEPDAEGRQVLGAYMPLEIDGVTWGLVGTIAMSEVLAPVNHAVSFVAITGVVVAALSLVPGLLVGRMVTNPIRQVVRVADSLAEGSFSGRIDESRNDEFGALARAVNSILNIIASIVGDVQSSAEAVATSSSKLAERTTTTARVLMEQEGEVSKVGAAVEELASSIQSVAMQCSSAADSSSEACREAGDGTSIVMRAMGEIREIAESVAASSSNVQNLRARSERIGEVVQVIDEIAEQTNLLALNAAIESARAGEHGRGFAVVADEVRKLAERTTMATEEIAATIQSMKNEMSSTVQSIEVSAHRANETVESTSKARDALERIVERSNAIGDAIQQIASATAEQGPAADHVAHSLQRMQEMMQHTRASGEEIAEITHHVSTEANELNSVAARFHLNRRKVDAGPPSGQSDRRVVAKSTSQRR